MTPKTVSDFAAERVRAERKKQDLTPTDLAARCRDLGYTSLSANVVKDIESGRRQAGVRRRTISVDEVYGLARVLGCSPMNLLPSQDGAPGTLGLVSEESIADALAGIRELMAFLEFQKTRGDAT